MSDTITCTKCGMTMTVDQERLQVRCVTVKCPLPHASVAGQAFRDANEETRGSMRGIIIGSGLGAQQ